MKVVKGEKEVAKVFVEDGDILEVTFDNKNGVHHLLIVGIPDYYLSEYGVVNLNNNNLTKIKRKTPLEIYEHYANKYKVKIIHKDRLSVVIDYKEEAK